MDNKHKMDEELKELDSVCNNIRIFIEGIKDVVENHMMNSISAIKNSEEVEYGSQSELITNRYKELMTETIKIIDLLETDDIKINIWKGIEEKKRRKETANKHSKRQQATNTTVDGKRIWLGYYATEDEAGKAYNNYAEENFGSFTNLNKISSV